MRSFLPRVTFIFGIFATWVFCCSAFGGCGEEELTGSGSGKVAIPGHIKRVPISTLARDPYWFFSADGFSPSKRAFVLTKNSEERLLAVDARVAAGMGFPSFAKQILMLRDGSDNKEWIERVQDRFAHYNSDDQQILGLAKLWGDADPLHMIYNFLFARFFDIRLDVENVRNSRHYTGLYAGPEKADRVAIISLRNQRRATDSFPAVVRPPEPQVRSTPASFVSTQARRVVFPDGLWFQNINKKGQLVFVVWEDGKRRNSELKWGPKSKFETWFRTVVDGDLFEQFRVQPGEPLTLFFASGDTESRKKYLVSFKQIVSEGKHPQDPIIYEIVAVVGISNDELLAVTADTALANPDPGSVMSIGQDGKLWVPHVIYQFMNETPNSIEKSLRELLSNVGVEKELTDLAVGSKLRLKSEKQPPSSLVVRHSRAWGWTVEEKDLRFRSHDFIFYRDTNGRLVLIGYQ